MMDATPAGCKHKRNYYQVFVFYKVTESAVNYFCFFGCFCFCWFYPIRQTVKIRYESRFETN